jgi:hypothetical protein
MRTSAWMLLTCALAAFAAHQGAADNKHAAEAVRQAVVYQEPGQFAAWPANNGIWVWQDEILVGFTLGYYKANDESHSIDAGRPARAVLARSLDGGETRRTLWETGDRRHRPLGG